MKKIILLTIFFGTILTFIIYKWVYHEPLDFVVLGDGIATGETAYQIEGYSFNDYLKEDLEKENKLEHYYKDFANKNETTETLLTKLKENITIEETKKSIQQTLSKAKYITLAIGMKELNQQNNLKTKDIETYLKNMDKILTMLRIYNNKKIIVISLYPTKNMKEEKIKGINEELEKICNTHQATWIDIQNIINNKSYFFDNTSYFLNYKGHKYISEQINIVE